MRATFASVLLVSAPGFLRSLVDVVGRPGGDGPLRLVYAIRTAGPYNRESRTWGRTVSLANGDWTGERRLWPLSSVQWVCLMVWRFGTAVSRAGRWGNPVVGVAVVGWDDLHEVCQGDHAQQALSYLLGVAVGELA